LLPDEQRDKHTPGKTLPKLTRQRQSSQFWTQQKSLITVMKIMIHQVLKNIQRSQTETSMTIRIT